MTADELVEFAEGLSRIAAGGGGPKALAAHLASLLDAAVLVEDAEWRHLALAGAGSRSIPPSTRDLLHAAPRNQGRFLKLQPPGGLEGMAFKMTAGDAHLGWLAVFPNGTPVGKRDGAIRLTASAIAVELSRELGQGKSRRRSFWERLIARAYDDVIEAKDDAASRGIALAPGYVAVAVEAEGPDEAANGKNLELRRLCLDTLRSGAGDIVVLERGAGLCFLCPAPREVDAANARTAATLIPRAISRSKLGGKVVGGVGRYAEVLNAYRTVDEARESLIIARRLYGGGRVMPYEDLGVYPILFRGGIAKEELQSFADRILDPLRAYDEKHQTELIRTLGLFFDVGQNVKTAAGSLNVHRHTVVYRLRQISEISGLNLDSPHDQLTLRTAMALHALNS